MNWWIRSFVTLASLLVAASAAATHPLFDRPIAITDRGIVIGTSTSTVKQFRGIPYAAPPVAAKRWKAPQPAAWFGALDASEFANHCPQPASPFGTASDTEDCLYLNVYVPKKKFLARHRPVMVWFHGGALFLGETDEYDPTRLVEQGVIVVTVNYRLGILGFLAHPALSAESPDADSGNYGIMDQQAALRWVKRNIAWFGGDPRNVTIFGESAGGLSVHTHLASPLSSGLFHQAIIQSGAYALTQLPLAAAEGAGQAIAAAAGCADQSAACLRGLSVAQVLAHQTTSGFVPNVDNHVLPQTVRSALASGDFNRVPVLEGTTHDEWRLFVALNQEFVTGPLTPAQYPGAIASTLGVSAGTAAFLANVVYPLANYPSPSVALGALGTDAIFACSGRASLGLLSQYVPTWGYEFNDPNPPMTILPPVSFPYGAYHSSEVQFLFDLDAAPPSYTPQEVELADTMVRYWTRFAYRGDPNAAHTPFWPGYDTATEPVQSLMPAGSAPTNGFAADHMCAFWSPPAP